MKPNFHVGSFSLAMAVGKREAFIPIKGTFITPQAQRERGKVIGRGVHIYIYIHIYVCERKKNLNRTLEIDSPFQTFAVGLLVQFIN